jgi:hypothetical protein
MLNASSGSLSLMTYGLKGRAMIAQDEVLGKSGRGIRKP